MALLAIDPLSWTSALAESDQDIPDLFADEPTDAIVEAPPAWTPERLCSTETVLPARVCRSWPEWDDGALQGLDSPARKFEANFEAIQTLHTLESTDRAATEAERRQLLRFSGWGGIPAAFNLECEDNAWRARAHRLASLLPATEHAAAKASVTDSFYTDPDIAHWMWAVLQQLGFQGGRILDPSAGTGHIAGCMPASVAQASDITCVEIDPVAARIAERLYGPHGARVVPKALQEAGLPSGWFDLAVSNIPFGDYPVCDNRNRPFSRFSIHAWFFGHALELVRPGGLVCFITSAYLMDATRDSVRAYLQSHANLVTAFRLPAGSFSRLGGTDVQADLIVLRRREPGASPVAEDWGSLAPVPSDLCEASGGEQALHVNEWFARHPANVLGKIASVSRGYAPVATARLSGSLQQAMASALEQVPQGAYAPAPEVPEPPRLVGRPHALPGQLPGSLVVRKGRIHQVEGEELIDVHERYGATQRARIEGLCVIRDHVRQLLQLQLQAAVSEHELDAARRHLNLTYDAFVRRHRCLSSRANALAFRRDPGYPLLLSLEHYDESNDSATKADIFTSRTVRPVAEPTRATQPEEALACSLQWRGRVDPQYIARLLQADDVTASMQALQASGKVFLAPESGRWEAADEYLSGNIRKKLAAAQFAGPGFEGNVTALAAVVPEDLPPSAINVRLGAAWIPSTDVELFISEVLELRWAEVRYSAEAGAWSVSCVDHAGRSSVRCTREFGTGRMDALEVLAHALNLQMPTVRDLDPVADRYVVNKEETIAARERLGLIKERFAQWAFEDTPRRERLCRIYNDLFNATRPRSFDGSHLVLPGFSQCFGLHPHQKDAIWRVVSGGNTGLFHCVGAGKTAVMAAASMEQRRLGLTSKPCHVVPNHMLAQYTAEFVRLYPAAKVLMASKEDLVGDARRQFVARVATGDWDAIVLTHSTFERIAMSPDYTARFVEDILLELELAILRERHGDRSNRIVKQLEAMKKRWKAKLERLLAEAKKDVGLTWEQLGIDWLYVDEAHCFKNLFRHSKLRVAGLPMTSSERAFDLWVKSRYTLALHRHRRSNADRGLVLATATPLANTMAELHTMQRYLQPTRLEELGLQQFDAWAATFGTTVTALELAPDGRGYRMNTRFAQFVNLPELMSLFCETADIRTAEMLQLPVPRIVGGKPRTVTCPPSPALKAYVQCLVKRAERIRNGEVKPEVDNMLAVTTDGRKAALDFRLVAPSANFDPYGKVARCVAEVNRIWKETTAFRGAQLVFCDLSSPKGGSAFSVYDDLRHRLIAAGIPAREIAFIHDAETDAQKAALFRAVREGHIRVLIGSTPKMGCGTNVHERLYALHHLDGPWRPCDVEQREGRIVRQGSLCEEVEILRYVTEQSFDAYTWQTLLSKAKFIAQVMRGDRGLRSVEDVELATLSYAEVKALASGNPLVIEKAGVDAEIARLTSLYSVWRDQRYRNQSEAAILPSLLEGHRKKLAGLEADAAAARDATPDVVTIDGVTYRGAHDVGTALRETVRGRNQSVWERRDDHWFGQVATFKLGCFVGIVPEDTHLVLRGTVDHECRPYITGPALYAELARTISSLGTVAAEARERLQRRERELAALEVELKQPFEHAARLAALVERQRTLAAELDLDAAEAGTEGLETAEELQMLT